MSTVFEIDACKRIVQAALNRIEEGSHQDLPWSREVHVL
jgi:hypothetical protein